MFVSLAYSIYMVSTTPLLDFKLRYKVQTPNERARSVQISRSLHVLTRFIPYDLNTQKSPNLVYLEL